MNYTPRQGSPFRTLPGHYQRAIQTQANIEVMGYKLSKTYGKKYNIEENALELFSNLCEKYAKNENKIKELACKDSKTLYLYPLRKDRESYYLQQATEYALQLDNSVKYLQIQKGNVNG